MARGGNDGQQPTPVAFGTGSIYFQQQRDEDRTHQTMTKTPYRRTEYRPPSLSLSLFLSPLLQRASLNPLLFTPAFPFQV